MLDMHTLFSIATFVAAAFACTNQLIPQNGPPTVAAGYQAQLVARGLTGARSILFDSNSRLIVLLQGSGIVGLDLEDRGGTCLSVIQTHVLVNDTSLNHGLELSPDGRTLYASSSQSAFSYPYNPDTASVGLNKSTLVTGMDGDDHVTRTLLLSRQAPGILLVSHGSGSNLDPVSLNVSSGHAQIRAFSLPNVSDTGYDYSSQGRRVGWGLRNSVGMAEHPITAGLYSVENSADQLQREGKDISNDNPGEELNYHGLVNSSEEGGNHGYPTCFTSWVPEDLPDEGNLTIGAQFVIGTPNSTINDDYCARERIPPRLAFQAHMAPLDIKFNNTGTEAWISFHGSWDRTVPVGYKVSTVAFQNGEPEAKSDNNTAAMDILSNPDLSKCPGGCFRPVGLVFDTRGRLYVSSDSTGEIFVIMKDEASGTSGGSQSSGAFASPTKTGEGTRVYTRTPLSWIGFLGIFVLVM